MKFGKFDRKAVENSPNCTIYLEMRPFSTEGRRLPHVTGLVPNPIGRRRPQGDADLSLVHLHYRYIHYIYTLERHSSYTKPQKVQKAVHHFIVDLQCGGVYSDRFRRTITRPTCATRLLRLGRRIFPLSGACLANANGRQVKRHLLIAHR